MPKQTESLSNSPALPRLSFDELVEGINAHKIEAVEFSCPVDARYSRCSIAWAYDEFPLLGKKAPSGIVVCLGKNRVIRFVSRLNPKLVEFKNKNGRYSLQDVWGKCTVAALTMAEEEKK